MHVLWFFYLLNNCPLRNKFKSSSSNVIVHISNPEPITIPRPRISDLPNVKLPIYEFTIKVNNSKTKNKILLDSGSQLNLIDVYFVKEYHIPYSIQSDFPRVTIIGGKQQILGKTSHVSIQYENHICKTQFYVVDLSSYCAILGTEWLITHNPNKLSFKSNHCIANCLVIPSNFTVSICTEEHNTSKNEEHNETNEINNDIQKILPAKLLLYKDVFDEKSANKLPPHRPYDCEIILKPNAKLHYGPIYPLTEKESLALKKYIKENEDKKNLLEIPNLHLLLLFSLFLKKT